MNKEELVKAFAAKGYTKRDSVQVIDDVCEVFSELLVAGEEIRLPSFGIFSIRNSKPRVTTNVANQDEKITIPAHKSVKFTPSKALQRAVREGFYRAKV